MRISNADDLEYTILREPAFVAQSMQRLGRFGGTHPRSNVLVHSIDTAMRLQRQGHSRSVVTWGLMHDAHELLSGDHCRGWASDSIVRRQMIIDMQLRLALRLALSEAELRTVVRADLESGHNEYHYWSDVQYESLEDDPVAQFVRILQEWRDNVAT